MSSKTLQLSDNISRELAMLQALFEDHSHRANMAAMTASAAPEGSLTHTTCYAAYAKHANAAEAVNESIRVASAHAAGDTSETICWRMLEALKIGA
jgi:hypothetical protein